MLEEVKKVFPSAQWSRGDFQKLPVSVLRHGGGNLKITPISYSVGYPFVGNAKCLQRMICPNYLPRVWGESLAPWPWFVAMVGANREDANFIMENPSRTDWLNFFYLVFADENGACFFRIHRNGKEEMLNGFDFLYEYYGKFSSRPILKAQAWKIKWPSIEKLLDGDPKYSVIGSVLLL